MLKGQKIYLRQVEPEDAPKLMLWENNPEHWRVSDTEVPFSMHEILQYIENAHHVRTTGQLRFIICKIDSNERVGAVDLYDANFKHGRAGVGILIGEERERNKGFAEESINLMAEYCTNILGFNNLYCSIHADNESSIKLFEKCDFRFVGTREGWFLDKGNRIDEIIYQLCLKR